MAVIVARFTAPHEAHVARLKLEAQGIRAFVSSEHSGILPGIPALGHVALQVADADAEAAVRILALDDPDASAALATAPDESLEAAEAWLERYHNRSSPMEAMAAALGRWIFWVLFAVATVIIFSRR